MALPLLSATVLRPLDWVVLCAYFLILIVSGAWLGRRRVSSHDYFLAGRRMPVWAVALSVVASSLSAATFIGVPQQSYEGDLSYLTVNLGQVIAALVVALFFIPAFYRHRVNTVYELLGDRYGEHAKRAASAMFMLGRVLASGARLYIAAIAASLVLFGDLDAAHLCLAIGVLTLVGVLYSLAGGLASIIWTDVLQTIVFVGAAAAALILLWRQIPLSGGEIVQALGPKLEAFPPGLAADRPWFGFDPAAPYTILTAVLGFSLLNTAAYATDQDLAQRMLTCRTGVKGSWSMISAILITVPVTVLFLFIGLLLHVFYQRADVVAANSVDDTRKVFLSYIMRELPPGMSGLMMAGLFAVGFASLLSALNAMASTFVNDFYRQARPRREDRHYLLVSRLAVVGFGALLGAFAVLCVFWQRAQGQTLIDFALGVMTFAYSGLLAVFLAALFTRRGNGKTVIAALLTGCGVIALMQNAVWVHWAPGPWRDWRLAYPWQMLLATALAFAVCCLGRTARSEWSPVERAAERRARGGPMVVEHEESAVL